MKLGAFDFLQKPFGIPELEMRVEKALNRRILENEVDYLRHERDVIYRIEDIIGESSAIKNVLKTVKKVARSKSIILITGETGTGKELVAAAIHYNSQRANGSFIKVNCAAIPDDLLESELFGHEKGAFTGAVNQRIGRFEQANGGTILLDEIGDMSHVTQAKILRVIQDQQFERLGGNATISTDVRVLAATNKDLAHEMELGNFREDLYFRLNVVTLQIPPLRDRGNDLELLAEFFIRRFNRDLGANVKGLSNDARALLLDYHWPGNVRELENTMERAVLMCEGEYLEADDLNIPRQTLASAVGSSGTGGGLELKNLEKEAVLEALRKTNFVQKDAAEILGISKRVMHYKIQQFGIKHPRWIRNK
jgi:DNA-binding NtrC family response regulator